MPDLFNNKYRIQSTRLPQWDYAGSGWYFVTICTQHHKPLFGEIRSGIMGLSETGAIAHRFWENIPSHFANVRLDGFIVMPNHLHGIVVIANNDDRADGKDAIYRVSTTPALSPSSAKPTIGGITGKSNPMVLHGSLSAVIRSYKAAVTRHSTRSGFDGFAWQSRFHDHIIRHEQSLNKIREYIWNNPARWEHDRYHTNNPS